MNENLLPDQEALIARVKAGDEIAFAKLFDFYRPKIYSVALALTKSETMAEDLVQDVFMTCWMKRENLATIKNFNSYLFIMVRNAAFTALRKLAKERSETSQQSTTEMQIYTFPENQNESVDYESILNQALTRLPEQQRRVFMLSKKNGMSRDAVAKELGISPNTVKIHLGRAIKFVRAWVHKNTLIWIFITHIFLLGKRN